MSYDVEAVRAQFPILTRTLRGGKPLIYLDSAASAQKPLAVLQAMDRYLREGHSNVHRGVHQLSAQATEQYEAARETARHFLGAERVSIAPHRQVPVIPVVRTRPHALRA